MVVEAVLVALLVLTAILFFTSLTRPTSGSDSGGIDIGSNAADTLDILQTRTFTVNCDGTQAAPDACYNYCSQFDVDTDSCELGPTQCDPNLSSCCALGDTAQVCALRRNGLMRLIVAGDPAVARTVDGFLSAVVPKGAEYVLRLNNGVGSLSLLPVNPSDQPHGARTASALFFAVGWNVSQVSVRETTEWLTPGQTVSSGSAAYNWVCSTASPACSPAPSQSILCIVSPTGQTIGPDGPDAGTAGDPWTARWRQGWDGTSHIARVPAGLPYGAWVGYTDSACTTAPSVIMVSLPGSAYPGQTTASIVEADIRTMLTGWTNAGGSPGLPLCLESPDGSRSYDPDGPGGIAPSAWTVNWTATPPANPDHSLPLAKHKNVQNQIPFDIKPGTWKASSAACPATDALALTGTVTTAVVTAATPLASYGLELAVWFGA